MKKYSLTTLCKKSIIIIFSFFFLTWANAQDFCSSKIVSCSSDQGYSMAIDDNGNLWAWGDSYHGIVGDNSQGDRIVPSIIIKGIKFKKVATRNSHFLALDDSGSLWSWGKNQSGQVGVGSDDYYINEPVIINQGTKFVEIATGDYHSLALDHSGNIWSWGNNEVGQLGDSTNDDRYLPYKLNTSVRFVKISAGEYHSMAIDESGVLWVWGYNYRENSDSPYGDYLEDPDDNPRSIPVQTHTSVKFKEIATGFYFTLAIDVSGNLWHWSSNSFPELKYSGYGCGSGPIHIMKETKFSSISVGRSLVLMVDVNGNVWTWGRNYWGQLGDGTTIDKDSPVRVPMSNEFENVSAGFDFSLAIDKSGKLWGWGHNESGQLGVKPETFVSSLIRIQEDTKFQFVNAIGSQTMAVDSFNQLWVWGEVSFGDTLVDGTIKKIKSPVPTIIDSNVLTVSNAMLIDKYGHLWGWGNNEFGQLGIDTTSYWSPRVSIKQDTRFLSVSKEDVHSMAIDIDSNLWGWGANYLGQLGIGDTIGRYSPVQIMKGTKFRSVYTGGAKTLAIDESGILWGWGAISSSILDNGTSSEKELLPIHIKSGTKFKSISIGGYHTMAIDESGCIWTWGENSNGFLKPNGYYIEVPIQIRTDVKFKAISAGYNNFLAIDESGNLWAAGYYCLNELKDNPSDISFSMIHLNSGVKFNRISNGTYNQMVIDENGNLYGYGSNSCGQIGNGTGPWRESPFCLNNCNLNIVEEIPERFEMKAYGITGQINIQSENPETYTIYNLMGSKVTTGKLQPGETCIPTQPGIYIFSAGGYRTKVLVK